MTREQGMKLRKENTVLKTQIKGLETEKEYYDNLCHKKTVECDDLRRGIDQFQSDNEKFIKKIEELEEKNAELKGELKAVKEILEELKESYNAVLDEVIDTARGYGLVSDSALFCYINEYDNKVIDYDELLDRIRNETIFELEYAIEGMKK